MRAGHRRISWKRRIHELVESDGIHLLFQICVWVYEIYEPEYVDIGKYRVLACSPLYSASFGDRYRSKARNPSPKSLAGGHLDNKNNWSMRINYYQSGQHISGLVLLSKQSDTHSSNFFMWAIFIESAGTPGKVFWALALPPPPPPLFLFFGGMLLPGMEADG